MTTRPSQKASGRAWKGFVRVIVLWIEEYDCNRSSMTRASSLYMVRMSLLHSLERVRAAAHTCKNRHKQREFNAGPTQIEKEHSAYGACVGGMQMMGMRKFC